METGDIWTGAPVAVLPANTSGRDFVCGDIHGGWDLLRRALGTCGFDRGKDRLFCVGDLIDRGEHSAEFEPWLDAAWFHPVLGNHEQMALRAMLGQDSQTEALWWMNGGGWILDHARDHARALIFALSELPLTIEIEGYGTEPVVIAHAGIPGNDWLTVRRQLHECMAGSLDSAEPLHTLLWDRARLARGDDARIAGARHVFHGHTVVDQVQTLGNRTYLDTGSVMTGHLTVLEIAPWVEARDNNG